MLKHDKHIGKEMNEALWMVSHKFFKGEVDTNFHSRHHTLKQRLQAHTCQDIGIHYCYAWSHSNLMSCFSFFVHGKSESMPKAGRDIL